MKTIFKYFLAILLIFVMVMPSIAGNKDRTGEAGAPELLINPWVRSSGWGGVNIANVNGLEATYANVAGLAFIEGVEFIIVNTQWLKGTGISISTVGLAFQLGDGNALAIKITSMGFGDIDKTEAGLPEPGIGTFSPTLFNGSISYAKSFSNSIFGGLTVRVISESVAEVKAFGVSFDAGIQYVTGDMENMKFGITLKNWSPNGMRFSGDGMSIRALFANQNNLFTTEHRSAKFELPSQLRIGGSYDFLFENETKFTIAGGFFSNAFTKDQFALGGEFAFKNFFMVRAAYTYEEGIYEKITVDTKTNLSKGLSAGVTVQIPFSNDTRSALAIDYSYRATDHFSGSHSFGAKLTF